MSEHIFGKNERLDRKLLDEKSQEGLDVQGNINAVEIDHDKVCEEFAILLGTTKMDRHWKALMMLRFSGYPIDLALAMAQRHGFLVGVKVHEAQMIEASALHKLKETLQGKGIENRASSINIAVPGNGHTDQPKDKICLN